MNSEMIGGWQKLEDLSGRFGLPHIPEYELDVFRKIFHAELMRALESKDAGPMALARRGRVRRVFGDMAGASADLKMALDLEPNLAEAHAWLGELDLRRPEAEESLTRGLAFAPARLYRGAGRLLRGELSGAVEDLSGVSSALGLILLGRAFERQRRTHEAIKAYKKAARLNPCCSAAALLWARAERKPRRILEACDQAFDSEPDYAHVALFQYEPSRDWAEYLGGLVSFAFEPKRAKAMCARFAEEDIRYSPFHFDTVTRAQSLARLHPGRAWALALVGRAISRCPPHQDRGGRSLKALSRAVALSPRRGWPYAWRALAWLQNGDTRRALKDLDACLRLQPTYYRAYGWRGALLRKLGKPEEALRDLDRAVAVDPGYPFSAHERSLARRAAGDWAGAVLDLDRAFALDFRYSWVHTAGREPSPEEIKRGLAELDRACAQEPRLASLLAWRGQLKLQRLSFSDAFEDFESAVQLDPHNALAFGWYGRGLVLAGQAERAVEFLRQAAALEPRLWIFQGWLAEADFRRGKVQKAFSVLRALLKAKPKAWWAYHERSRFYLETGRARQALADARRAIGLEGRDVEGYYLEAQALLALENLPAAEEAVGKALIISPNLGRGYVLRAQIRQRLGRAEKALEDYRATYERFPYLFNEDEKGRMEALLR